MATFRPGNFILYPSRIHRYHARLAKTQYEPPARRRERQRERLAAILDYAVRHVPYYRRTLALHRSRFADMVARLDIGALPLLTKADIRNNWQALHADGHNRMRASMVSTSGTTGTRSNFLQDGPSHIAHFANVWNFLNWTGYRFGERIAEMTCRALPGGVAYRRRWELNFLEICNARITTETIHTIADRLERFAPVIFKALPTSGAIFSDFMREAGRTPPAPRAVMSCAETLHTHLRAKIMERFNCPLFDFYNQNERACLITSCEAGRYHIHEDYSFVETPPAADGNRHIIATTLHNRVMPLIRYDTGDLARPDTDESACSCGRGYRTLGPILGRSCDVVITPDGRHHNSLEYIFEQTDNIRMAQVYQEKVGSLEIRVIPAPGYDRARQSREITELAHHYLGDDIRITVTYPERLNIGATGKINLVESLPGRALLNRPSAAAGPSLRGAE